MSPRPFLPRLILPFAAVLVLIIALCGAIIHFAGERQVRIQQVQDLNNLTSLVKQWLADSAPNVSGSQREQLRSAAHLLNTRITLIGGDGTVIFDTDASPALMENHNNRPEVVDARAGNVGSSVRESATLNQSAVYVAELVDPQRADGLVVRLSYPRYTWAAISTPFWMIVGAAVAAALLVTALLGWMLQTQWIGPTRTLSAAAERMTAGEWGVRAEPRGADDIRAFGSRLNLLAAQAEKQLADLQHQRQDLKALVDTLPDPILVVDAQQRIVLINTPAARLLELSPAQVVAKKVVGMINDQAVLELLESAPALRPVDAASIRSHLNGATRSDVATGTTQHEIHLHRDGQSLTYQAVVTHTAGGGVVLVLRDVSTLSQAVQMKTDFVANASHELRTPISAIKIAFETLRDVYVEDPEQAQRCVGIIDGHLHRLEEMLRDLLDLSRVENAEHKPLIARVKASDIFATMRATMGSVARDKQIELKFEEPPPEEATFQTDERLLNLLLKNLIENSVKFTPAGGKVSVAIQRRRAEASAQEDTSSLSDSDAAEPHFADAVIVTVRDTGIGIAPEHLERVFERFYQADPARSGSAGRGTGLGLAIVKHAVAALGGTIQLKSRLGAGTTVTCVLPQTPAEAPATLT